MKQRGRWHNAIHEFAVANKPDPILPTRWKSGETLLLKNRSDLALEKFEDANK